MDFSNNIEIYKLLNLINNRISYGHFIINENNYRDKFEEFISEPDNPKWEKISNAGRKFVMEEMNNDKAVESLLVLMRKLL